MDCTRNLGSEMKISRLGYGAWALGNPWTPLEDAYAVLDTYLEGGGNFIDTAQGYKVSEERIGAYLKERNLTQKVIVASKTPKGGSRETIGEIEASIDDSLKKLQRDYVDLYYFHSPPSDSDVMEEALAVMKNMVKKGKIRGIGASIKGPNVSQETVDLCHKYMETNTLTAIQLIYSVMRQTNSQVFEEAQKNKVALVGRTSLESGFLTGKYERSFRFPEEDYRSKWNPKFEQIWDLVHDAQGKYANGDMDQFKTIALQFALNPEAITSTIVGARTGEQMKGLLEIANKPPLSQDIIAQIKGDFQDAAAICNAD